MSIYSGGSRNTSKSVRSARVYRRYPHHPRQSLDVYHTPPPVSEYIPIHLPDHIICIPDNPWMSTRDSVSPYTGDTHAPDHPACSEFKLHTDVTSCTAIAFYHMSFLFPDPMSGVWERDYIQACSVVHVTYDFPAGENGTNFLLMEETLLQVLQLKSSGSCSNKHLRTFTYTLRQSTTCSQIHNFNTMGI